MRRYLITQGAKTTAGGVVTGASANRSINGVRVALEGDAVDCPACKSSGRIVCSGARLAETAMGKAVALENDLCMCACASPPRLLANQQLVSQTSAEGTAGVAGGDDGMAGAVASAAFGGNEVDARPLQFIDESNGWPMAMQTYRLEFPLRVVEGRTDEYGYTEAIAVAELATLLAWKVGEQSGHT